MIRCSGPEGLTEAPSKAGGAAGYAAGAIGAWPYNATDAMAAGAAATQTQFRIVLPMFAARERPAGPDG
jgi:hypothetical protein